MGNYRDGKFNLILSLRYEADAVELELWHQAFQKASELLFTATDGQQQFGKIFACNNSTGGKNADVWLYEDPGGSSSNARIWEEFIHAQWMNDEKYKPFVIVHESGHYLYALGDEYKESDGDPANCIGDPAETPNACIMERGWWEGDRFGDDGSGGDFVEGPTTDFCVTSNHDLGIGSDDEADDTVQSTRHGEACWQTIVDTYPDVVLPGDLPEEDRPAEFDEIEWIELAQDLRFVLVLDRSGSMGIDGAKPMEEVIYGASFWADSTLDGDYLGVVGFDNLIETLPLTQINNNADRDAVVDFIDDLTPRGTTAIGDALRQASDLITEAGDQSCTQVIVLFSDGMHNTGEDPLDVLPDLIASGIRVYTIGFGPYADVDRLTAIAEGTGGTFYQIDSDLDLAAAEEAIRDTLIVLSEEVRDDGGIVTADAAILDAEHDGDHEVLIDSECSVATFAISWKGNVPLTLRLRSPRGRVITAETEGEEVRHAHRGMPFRIFQIQKPEPGIWRYRVHPAGTKVPTHQDPKLTEPIYYRHYVFSENKTILFELTSPRRRYEVGEPIQILGQVTANEIVTGVPIHGYVTVSEGKSYELTLVDNGDLKHGSEIADSGRFSTVFLPPSPGHYTFTFVADNRDKLAHTALHGDVERTRKRGDKHRAPAFVRQASFTVLVGKPRTRCGDFDPKVIRQGYKGLLRVDLRNIPWVPGVSKLNLGRDVKVSEQPNKTCEAHQPTFMIAVSHKAQPGFRDAVLSVGRQRYRLEGVIRIEGDPQETAKIDPERTYRPGFVLRKRFHNRRPKK